MAFRVAGLERLGRGVGAACAFLFALLWSRIHVPPVVDRWLERHPQHPSPDLVWDPPPPAHEISLGKTQPLAFSLVLAAVLAAAFAYFMADELLMRWRVTRPFAWVLRAAVAVAALVFAKRTSPFVFQVALGMLVPAGLLFASQKRDATPAALLPSRSSGGIVLVAEALCIGWGLWLTLWDPLNVLAILPMLALAAAAGAVVGQRYARGDDEAIRRDAVVFAPLLAIPLLALKRAPSPLWLCLPSAACVLVALAVRRSRFEKWVTPTFGALSAVVGPWALGAMVLIPMRFREIPNINHWDHEGIHLGWVNSITFGKLMMADAGFVYGPLREYMLAFVAWLFGGITLEHVRESHFILNLTGLALMVYAGWLVARRKPWLHLWWVYVVLAETQLALLLKYHEFITFGWLDGTRPALALVAVTGAIDVVTGAPRSQVNEGFFRANRKLFAWGLLCGAAVLYSQDFGPCAFGGVGLAIGADSLLRRNAGSFADRARRIGRLAGTWTLGVLIPIALFVVVYACFGEAGILAKRVTTWTGFLASASWSGLRFPIGADGYLRWATLANRDDRGVVWVDYLVPPFAMLLGGALIMMALVRRAWTARTTLYLALFAFSLTSFRHALIRSDVYHLRSDGTGAILLLFAILCDLAPLKLRFGRRARAVPVGAITVAFLAIGWTSMEQSWDPMRVKLHSLASGEETPSQGEPYDNRGVPRAGDVNVPADIKALVKYVSETTTRKDPVLCTTGFMTGGELAFIIDRKNPIPFDVAHELTTREDQAEVRRDLEATPPVLIIGDYLPLLGKPARDFIDAHWKRVTVPGFAGVVRRYQPTTEAPSAP